MLGALAKLKLGPQKWVQPCILFLDATQKQKRFFNEKQKIICYEKIFWGKLLKNTKFHNLDSQRSPS